MADSVLIEASQAIRGNGALTDVRTIARELPRPETPEGGGLTFSRHLQERLSRRRLEMDGETMQRLNEAVQRASQKGARDSVVLLDDLAVLVNVTNRTVLTAMQTRNMRDGVFTNIDSVVVG